MEQAQNTIKIVILSDTHSQIEYLKIPEGDILIHAGDFSYQGKADEVEKFCKFLQKLTNFKHKLVIAGNHDLTLDVENYDKSLKYNFGMDKLNIDAKKMKEMVQSCCTYLEDQSINLYGYNFYGSPYTPEFFGWAFMKEIKDLQYVWQKIPTNTDILITHGPPKDILDLCVSGQHAGCPYLREEVQKRIQPIYHIFGHIHETYGIKQIGKTTYINASNVNLKYKPVNPPIVIELPIKEKN